MSDRPSRLRLRWQDADRLITATLSQSPVDGLTHNFYKYPARFSPDFARAAIDSFSEPGDLVADPFVGGGTTLVEARARGRTAIGTDISTLATFVSKTKTQMLTGSDIEYMACWFEKLPDRINLRRSATSTIWTDMGYDRNLDCSSTWPIRKSIELSLASVKRIRDHKRQNFARCVILRTAQWALDGRRTFPTAQQFRDRISSNTLSMLDAAANYTRTVRRADHDAPTTGRKKTICLNSKAEGLADYIRRTNRGSPRLVVTSPPYPGVHIVYHRWQVRGGRETPAPFWIANQLDGAGEAYYLMSARRPDLRQYSEGIHNAFSNLSSVIDRNCTIIQLVAFSNPRNHLPLYLDIMRNAGLKEYVLSDHIDSKDGRIWRDIPGRKWHANKKGKLASSKEVLLIHKVR